MQDSNQTPSVRYCLCTLAFGSLYRIAAQKLAKQLEQQGIELIVVTDVLSDFSKYSNTTAIKAYRTSIFYAYNDKRFALEAALQRYECAVFVDADSEIKGLLPKKINPKPGLTGFIIEKKLEEMLIRYHPQNIQKFKKLAGKLNVELSDLQWIKENLLIIRRDNEKEAEFLAVWAFVDRWLGLRRVFQGDAAFIGLAVGAVGWRAHQDNEFLELRQLIVNLGTGRPKNASRLYWNRRRIGFYWRTSQALLESLKDLKAYYF